MKEFKTPKGTILPLLDLRGKPYMQVAHRLVWFTEEVANYEIETNFLLVDEEQTIAQATITLRNDSGAVLRRVQATKRETKRDFSDHTEKAETSAIGRAVALLGFGTQFAVGELDEGDRLADSPVNVARNNKPAHTEKPSPATAPFDDAPPIGETQAQGASLAQKDWGDYVPPFGKWSKEKENKPLRRINDGEMDSYIAYLKKMSEKDGKPLSNSAKELINMVVAYRKERDSDDIRF